MISVCLCMGGDELNMGERACSRKRVNKTLLKPEEKVQLKTKYDSFTHWLQMKYSSKKLKRKNPWLKIVSFIHVSIFHFPICKLTERITMRIFTTIFVHVSYLS